MTKSKPARRRTAGEDASGAAERQPALTALTPAALRRLRRHILSIARKAEAEAYRERMAGLRAKKMALPPRRRKRARPDA